MGVLRGAKTRALRGIVGMVFATRVKILLGARVTVAVRVRVTIVVTDSVITEKPPRVA